MALDYGERRIGVAVTDPSGILAQPLETITRSKRASEAHLLRIAELVNELGVDRIVIGLPLHMDGRAGPEVEAVRAFGKDLQRHTDARLEYLDERWTTVEADRVLRSLGDRGQKKRRRLDPTAAAILLRTFLEQQVS